MQKEVEALSGASITLNFEMNTLLLREAEVVTDIAIERETPVAFSNIKPIQIQEELGSQPIPMILNSTPAFMPRRLVRTITYQVLAFVDLSSEMLAF